MREKDWRAVVGSCSRVTPRPSPPNSGLRTTSPPSCSNACMPSSADWHATVRGTSRPAAARRQVARYLSTAASSALAGLITHTPAASSCANASMRKTTCSSDPGGIVRTMAASASLRGGSPAATLGRPPISPVRSWNEAVATSWRSAAARFRSRTCQPFGEPRTTTRMAKARAGAAGFRRRLGFACSVQPTKDDARTFGS